MKLAATAATLLGLIGASAAFADDHGSWRNHAPDRGDSRDSRDWRNHDRDNHDRDNHRYEWRDQYREQYRDHRNFDRDRRENWRPHYESPHYDRYHYEYRNSYRPYDGYRPYYRHFSRGGYLPSAYFAPSYVIADYRGCGLRAPPYGARWIRVDNDAFLAGIATGVILDVVYNQF